MKRSSLLACKVLLGLSAAGAAAPAGAYYDDVHFALTYYIARQTGYTPEQAYRIASADVSVDYDPGTEPVQPTGQGLLTFAGYSEKAEPPRWKFHAMRNTQQHPDAYGNGTDALIADGEIIDQRKNLWNLAVNITKNPGVFLHFFQDEVPHKGYGSAWGHWPILPDVFDAHLKRGLLIGGGTDWISHRPGDVTILTEQCSSWLKQFMQAVSPYQSPRDYDQRDYNGLIARLVTVNKEPAPLDTELRREMYVRYYLGNKDLIFGHPNVADLAELEVQLRGGPPANLKGQATGPDLEKAIPEVNNALGNAGMQDRLDRKAMLFPLTVADPSEDLSRLRQQSFTPSTVDGDLADEGQRDQWVLVGRVAVTVLNERQQPLDKGVVSLKLAKLGKNFPEARLGQPKVIDTPGAPVVFDKMPVGDLIVEINDLSGMLLLRKEGVVLRGQDLAVTVVVPNTTSDWVLKDGRPAVSSFDGQDVKPDGEFGPGYSGGADYGSYKVQQGGRNYANTAHWTALPRGLNYRQTVKMAVSAEHNGTSSDQTMALSLDAYPCTSDYASDKQMPGTASQADFSFLFSPPAASDSCDITLRAFPGFGQAGGGVIATWTYLRVGAASQGVGANEPGFDAGTLADAGLAPAGGPAASPAPLPADASQAVFGTVTAPGVSLPTGGTGQDCTSTQGPFHCTGNFHGSYDLSCTADAPLTGPGASDQGDGVVTIAADGSVQLTVKSRVQQNDTPTVIRGRIDASGKAVVEENEPGVMQRWDGQLSLRQGADGRPQPVGGGVYKNKVTDHGVILLQCLGTFSLDQGRATPVAAGALSPAPTAPRAPAPAPAPPAAPATLAPNATGDSDPGARAALLGSWIWASAASGEPVDNGTMVFNADGSMYWSNRTSGTAGAWQLNGRKLHLSWRDGSKDDLLTLSADGTTLDGSDTSGRHVRCRKQGVASGNAAQASTDAGVTRAQQSQWVQTGISDCPGGDVGRSNGATPEAARCTADRSGQSAVCWDGRNYSLRFEHVGEALCTYKTTRASACSGGQQPGYLYECRSESSAPAPQPIAPPPQPIAPPPQPIAPPPQPVAPAPQPAAPAPPSQWVERRIDDCSGGDVGRSNGATPEAARCTADRSGQTAVCWDGKKQSLRFEHVGEALCTYKTTRASQCTGGLQPGYLYECRPESAAPAPQPAASAAQSRWVQTRISDCPGGDLGRSNGATPEAARCTADRSGQSAVCWDGKKYSLRFEHVGEALCTYKTTKAGACNGGQQPGYLYECRTGP